MKGHQPQKVNNPESPGPVRAGRPDLALTTLGDFLLKGGESMNNKNYPIPKYPHIKVKLVGEDGNAFAILGKVKAALRRAGLDDETISTFVKQATWSDYDHLLRTVQEWVDVE